MIKMMNLKLDPDSPIYVQIVDHIKILIASGQLESGSPLPSVRNLAFELDINPMTISRAYAILLNEKIAVRRRGQQMLVNEVDREALKMQLLDESIEKLSNISSQLNIDKSEVSELLLNHKGE